MQNSLTNKKLDYLDLKSVILNRIKDNGGWVNAHAHIDRAFTVTEENLKYSTLLRTEKWKLNAELRKNSTVNEIYSRMSMAVELLLEQGVKTLGSFIDVDYDVKDKAILAAEKLKSTYSKDINIRFLNQSSYGLFDKDSFEWFNIGAEFVDIIGGLLKADKGRESEHLDILLSTAKRLNKMVHIHVDEMSLLEERETELLAKKTIEHGMQGKVVAIHALSINMHSKEYRDYVYKLAKEAGLMFISCPVSWLNTRRSEEMSPTHNPLTPVDELLENGMKVAIGVDNIADIWMPYNDANMWNELRVLMEMGRIYDIEKLVDISTINGLKVLGIGDEPKVKIQETVLSDEVFIEEFVPTSLEVIFQAKISLNEITSR